MVYYKVEIIRSGSWSDSKIATYYFKSKDEADNFIKKGNELFQKYEAYDYHIFKAEPTIINIADGDKILERLEKKFNEYK